MKSKADDKLDAKGPQQHAVATRVCIDQGPASTRTWRAAPSSEQKTKPVNMSLIDVVP